MFTRLGLITSIFFILIALSVSGIIPSKKPVGAAILTLSFLVSGFLAAFKTEQAISPLFRPSRFFVIAFKVLGWWFIVLGLISLTGLIYFMLSI